MKQKVMLSIRGRQTYLDQEPDVIELVTEGTMENVAGVWTLCYEESDLTGLAGVTTTFRMEPGKITLTRTGKLNSEMVFQEGVFHNSLYQMEFGALMIVVDLVYGIEIEQSTAGVIDYHLEITPKE